MRCYQIICIRALFIHIPRDIQFPYATQYKHDFHFFRKLWHCFPPMIKCTAINISTSLKRCALSVNIFSAAIIQRKEMVLAMWCYCLLICHVTVTFDPTNMDADVTWLREEDNDKTIHQLEAVKRLLVLILLRRGERSFIIWPQFCW